MPSLATPKLIILFDGVCNLCNSSVNFIIRNDSKNKFRFAGLQSEKANELLVHFPDYINENPPSSIVLIEEDKFYIESTAALKICKRLNGLYPLFYIFIIIPPFIRDALYNLIARNRYKWFGRTEQCQIPSPELIEKFVEKNYI